MQDQSFYGKDKKARFAFNQRGSDPGLLIFIRFIGTHEEYDSTRAVEAIHESPFFEFPGLPFDKLRVWVGG